MTEETTKGSQRNTFDELVEMEEAELHKANKRKEREFGGYIVNTAYLSKPAGYAVERYLRKIDVE